MQTTPDTNVPDDNASDDITALRRQLVDTKRYHRIAMAEIHSSAQELLIAVQIPGVPSSLITLAKKHLNLIERR